MPASAIHRNMTEAKGYNEEYGTKKSMNIDRSKKFIFLFALCFAFRLLPFRPPNFEPVLASQMPISKTQGRFAGFLFGFLSILIFDMAVGKFGLWSLATGTAFGALGLFASVFFRNKSGVKNYVAYAVIATIVYDAVTGLTIGPAFFGQSFLGAFLGQIPFTLMHLAGNIALAVVWSPFVERWLLKEREKPILEIQKQILSVK